MRRFTGLILLYLTIGLVSLGHMEIFAAESAPAGVIIQGSIGNKAIAAGGYYTLVLKEDGTVVAWGNNSFGQCNIPTGLKNVKAIAAGESHAVALKEDGTVVAWGNNSSGQCNVPDGLTNVKSISAGAKHTVVLKEDDTATVWGDNEYGQCNIPKSLRNVRAIDAGDYYTAALKEDGTVVAWGDNSKGQCNIPDGLKNVKAITAGYCYTVALKEDSTIIVWGHNLFGQCNIPNGFANVKAVDAGSSHTVALKEDGTVVVWGNNYITDFNAPTGLTGVKAIAAGNWHTVALKEDGAAIAWGDNSYGQCATELAGIKAVAAGYMYSVALREDGTVVAWGDNYYDQCSIPNGLTKVKAISAGYMHTAALKEDGTVAVWGNDWEGQCDVPAGLAGIKSIAAGDYFTLALKEDGTVAAWGENYLGQCNVPDGLAGVKAIAAGSNHTLALKEDGTVIAWGDNKYGQCDVPVGLTNVKAVAAGSNHSVALKEDGTIVIWGDNSYGQNNIPQGLTNIKAIDAGSNHTVVLKEDGSVAAWGSNDYGQCNITTGVKTFAAGFNNTVVLKNDGQVVSFGDPGFIIPAFKELPKNIIVPAAVEFDMLNSGDIIIKTDGSASTLQSIKNGSTALAASDYSILGNTVIIKKSYFSYFFTKFNASWVKLNLTFDFKFGSDPVLTILRTPNSVSCNIPFFELSNPQDIIVNLKGGTVKAVKNGDAVLSSSDYSISGSAITIKKSYLTYFFTKFNDPWVKLGLTFDFESGDDAVLTIYQGPVVNTITCSRPLFDLDNPLDVRVNTSGSALCSVQNGSTELANSDYSILGNVVTINRSYLTYFFTKFNLPGQKLNLTFKFVAGNNAGLTISRASISNIITCNNPVFDLSNPQDITVNMTGGMLKAIKNGSVQLSAVDYSVLENAIIIKKSYLTYFFTKFNESWHKLNLTFDFENGDDPVLTISPVSTINAVTCSSPLFDSANPQDIKLNISGYALSAIKNGSVPLTSADYSVSGSTVTIRKDYLLYFFNKFNLPGQKLSLTFDFEKQNDIVLNITRK